LEETNDPSYFHDFISRAAQHGLEFLSEASVPSMIPNKLQIKARRKLKDITSDFIRGQQYLDFLINRTFRQTLLVHEKSSFSYDVPIDRIRAFQIACQVRRFGPLACDPFKNATVTFVLNNNSSFSTENPLIAMAFSHLAEIWPKTASFDELLTYSAALIPHALVSSLIQ
jgi:methyltransferase-like protein